MAAPIVLSDQDGVLADFELGFYNNFVSLHGCADAIDPRDRTTFYASDQLGAEWKETCRKIVRTEGFFEGLAPIAGGLEALEGMRSAGLDVWICTSPIVDSRFCAGEKARWVQDHLGKDWASRLIITADKTLVRGDVLVDDRLGVRGSQTPSWSHVLFGAPYNSTSSHPLRLDDWASWRTQLLPILGSLAAR